MVQLSSHVASSAHLAYHVNVVHEKFVRRQMILGFNKLFALATDDTMDLDETMREAHELLDSIEKVSSDAKSHWEEMDVLMSDTMREAQGRISNNRTELRNPHRLVGARQDDCRMAKGDLNIASRPSVGRKNSRCPTAWPRRQRFRVPQTVVYSIEMAGERLADRLILSHAQIGADQWKTGQLNEQELGVAQAAVSNLSQLPMRVDDTGSAGMDPGRARMLHSKGLRHCVHRLFAVVARWRPTKYTRNREQQEVAQAAHKAKDAGAWAEHSGGFAQSAEPGIGESPAQADVIGSS